MAYETIDSEGNPIRINEDSPDQALARQVQLDSDWRLEEQDNGLRVYAVDPGGTRYVIGPQGSSVLEGTVAAPSGHSLTPYQSALNYANTHRSKSDRVFENLPLALAAAGAG